MPRLCLPALRGFTAAGEAEAQSIVLLKRLCSESVVMETGPSCREGRFAQGNGVPKAALRQA
eukprot:scaffold7386_cov509-Prasinococcus_capsulatus_cf.AAC.4